MVSILLLRFPDSHTYVLPLESAYSQSYYTSGSNPTVIPQSIKEAFFTTPVLSMPVSSNVGKLGAPVPSGLAFSLLYHEMNSLLTRILKSSNDMPRVYPCAVY